LKSPFSRTPRGECGDFIGRNLSGELFVVRSGIGSGEGGSRGVAARATFLLMVGARRGSETRVLGNWKYPYNHYPKGRLFRMVSESEGHWRGNARRKCPGEFSGAGRLSRACEWGCTPLVWAKKNAHWGDPGFLGAPQRGDEECQVPRSLFCEFLLKGLSSWGGGGTRRTQ